MHKAPPTSGAPRRIFFAAFVSKHSSEFEVIHAANKKSAKSGAPGPWWRSAGLDPKFSKEELRALGWEEAHFKQ